MISFLKGRLVQKEPGFVVIEVGGIGYQVSISLHTFTRVKDLENIQLYTHLVVREDAHILFGFFSLSERSLFQNLIGVNGVGPNTALLMLSYLSVEELKSAIVHEDVKTLQSVKGIGGKTAQRVIIELKDKFRKEGPQDQGDQETSSHNTLRREALSALLTLGLPKATAEKSVEAALKRSGKAVSLEELVKQALKNA